MLNLIATIAQDILSQELLDVITQPPLSSIIILIIGFIVSLFSTLVSRYMIDIDKLKRLTRETKKYNQLRMQMLKTADSKLKLKYERNADRMRKMQSELTMLNMRPLLITFVPLIIFFAVFSGIFDPKWVSTEAGYVLAEGSPIPAIIPFNLPEQVLFLIGRNTIIDGWGSVFVPQYVWWYFGASLVSSSILRKVSGLQPD